MKGEKVIETKGGQTPRKGHLDMEINKYLIKFVFSKAKD